MRVACPPPHSDLNGSADGPAVSENAERCSAQLTWTSQLRPQKRLARPANPANRLTVLNQLVTSSLTMWKSGREREIFRGVRLGYVLLGVLNLIGFKFNLIRSKI